MVVSDGSPSNRYEAMGHGDARVMPLDEAKRYLEDRMGLTSQLKRYLAVRPTTMHSC